MNNVIVCNMIVLLNQVPNYRTFWTISALMRERDKALKQAGIGGKWELIDPQGNKVSSDLFKGKWCMLYFGFTHCPGWFKSCWLILKFRFFHAIFPNLILDICPDEMEKMTNVVKGLGWFHKIVLNKKNKERLYFIEATTKIDALNIFREK